MPINFIDLEQKFNELKTKFDLPREEFLQECWDWTNKH